MDRGAWHEAIHRVEKESDTTPAVDRSSSGLAEPTSHHQQARPVGWGLLMTSWTNATLFTVLACFAKQLLFLFFIKRH